MQYETYKEIMCKDTDKRIKVGDVVTIHWKNGGGAGSCKITKITDTGFHYTQGSRTKTAQYKNVAEIC